MKAPGETASGPGGPDPLESIAQRAEGTADDQSQGGSPTPSALDPEAEERIKIMEGLATGLIVLLLSKARAYLSKDLPEFAETCPDELLQPPASEAVKLGRDYLAKLTEMAGSSAKLAPLAMALAPLVLAYVGALQAHADKQAPDKLDAPAASG